MPTALITVPPACLASEPQPSRRHENTLGEEPPDPGPERESARHALPYVLGLLGFFVGAMALILVLKPTAGEHLTILLGMCSAMLGALAVWILHDARPEHA